MTIAVSRLVLAATVKERNFHFGMHVTLIHLLYDSVSEIP